MRIRDRYSEVMILLAINEPINIRQLPFLCFNHEDSAPARQFVKRMMRVRYGIHLVMISKISLGQGRRGE
jgi:hypothetical protein